MFLAEHNSEWSYEFFFKHFYTIEGKVDRPRRVDTIISRSSISQVRLHRKSISFELLTTSFLRRLTDLSHIR